MCQGGTQETVQPRLWLGPQRLTMAARHGNDVESSNRRPLAQRKQTRIALATQIRQTQDLKRVYHCGSRRCKVPKVGERASWNHMSPTLQKEGSETDSRRIVSQE